MTDNLKNILDRQITEELYSAHLYLALAAKLERWGFKGAAGWMRSQSQEERDHAAGFIRFLLERGAEPTLGALPEPATANLKNMVDVFAAGLHHEKHITECINRIYEAAAADKNYALMSFIKWYIDEQVEEEAAAVEVLDKLNLIGGQGAAVYLLDQELSARTYRPSGPYAA